MNNKKYIKKIINCFDISSLYDLEELENIIGSIRAEVIDEFVNLYDKWLFEECGKHINDIDLISRVSRKLKEQK